MPPPRQATLQESRRIFVDREQPQNLFENAAFSIPADRAIIRVFYGVGGQGKSALCRELMRKTDVSLEPSYTFLRRALLDLHGRVKSDPDLLLVWIRNGFAEAGVVLPCFDLALALMWEGTRPEQPYPALTKPWLARSTKVAEGAVDEGASEIKKLLGSDTATELLGEAVSEIPGVGFLLKRIGKWAIDKSKHFYLEHTREHLQHLYYSEGEKKGELKDSYKLSELLPWMLAQDLNYHLTHNPADRFILFIDEYERVFEQGGAGVLKENPFDNHIRALARETNGLLVVFFSRERLPWSDDPDWRNDLDGNEHLLGGLAYTDADKFLRAIPIADEDIRGAIINGAREQPHETAAIYPLMLDLQVEHWRVLAAKREATPDRFTITAGTFAARRNELVKRVLRDYSDPLRTTLERLSVARRFDRAAFEHVVRTFGTALPLDNFDRLADLSFVTRSDDGFLTLHNVVAEAIRETVSEEKRRTSVAALFEHFSSRVQSRSHPEVADVNVTALFEADYLRQAQGLHGYAEWLSEAAKPVAMAAQYAPLTVLWRQASIAIEKGLGAEHPDTATSLGNLALLIEDRGDLAGARPLFERALAVREKTLGAEHPKTATSLNNLACLLEAQGDLAGARPLFERALAVREKALGAEHPDTSASLNNLACLLRAQGDFAGARPLFEQALAIHEKALGQQHPNTAATLNNLADLLEAQGDLAGARPLFERALAIQENVLGAEHPDTAASLNNLASVLRAQGDLAGARPLFERALAIREKRLGAEHPRSGVSLNNLAELLQAQGDLAGARPLLERALAISEKTLGAEHPHTAASLNNLALLLEAQGDLAAARPLLERALAISEKSLGAEHPGTATSLSNLASLLRDQGSLARARSFFERALAICEKALGQQHPNTAATLNDLAMLLEAEGDLVGARPLYERALAIRKERLGEEHPVTSASLNNLACLLRAQGDLAGARPLLERALAIREKTLGAEHPDTAMSLSNLASLLQAQGDLAGARPLLERALAIHENTLGAEHPDTATSLNNLAELFRVQGDLGRARPLFERALAIWGRTLGPEHPNTATILNNFASLLRAQGDLAGARPLFERALAIYERALGADHPHTGMTRNIVSLIGTKTAKPSPKPQSSVSRGKVGRNEPCPCGSGKKYKHCHGSLR